MIPHLRLWNLLALAGGLVALAACDNPGSVGTAASPSPSASPSAEASAKSDLFREDFDGSALDDSRWQADAQSGLIQVTDGSLELLNTAKQPNFPYVVTRERIIPDKGPFYFEMKYTYLAAGTMPSFCLDYLPPEKAGMDGLTKPFLSTKSFYSDMVFSFDTENADPSYSGPGGMARNQPHTYRLEYDGNGTYRLIFDDVELGTLSSERRPMKFWIGSNPQSSARVSNWARVSIDYVEAGVLTTPASAKPAPTPTPAADDVASEEAVATP